MRYLLLFSLLVCSVPAFAGYTVFEREKVSPQYTIVPSATGQASRLNQGAAPTYPSSFMRMVYRAPNFSIYSSNSANRRELWEDANSSTPDSTILAAFPGLRLFVVAQIVDLRKSALDRIALSPGVSAIYDENYQASVYFQEGQPNIVMKNGMTAQDYLAGFGAKLGMTAAQFAAYIVTENVRVGPTAYQIEQEYLRLCYGVIPRETSVANLLGYPDSYKRFTSQ